MADTSSFPLYATPQTFTDRPALAEAHHLARKAIAAAELAEGSDHDALFSQLWALLIKIEVCISELVEAETGETIKDAPVGSAAQEVVAALEEARLLIFPFNESSVQLQAKLPLVRRILDGLAAQISHLDEELTRRNKYMETAAGKPE